MVSGRTRHEPHKMGFENVVGGKLKLKGAAIEKREKKKKKKKKKKKNKDDDETRKREYVELNEDDDSDDDEHFQKRTSSREKKEDENYNKLDKRTDAEKAHEERSRQQRKKRILEHAELSHKDKVRLFNEKLGRLSEHHDIPKVGPG